MPSRESTASEPGRESDKDRKRAAGACDVGVIENRLDAHAAPSGALDVTGGTFWAMMLFNGSARPRIPLKSGASGSSSTSDAAAAGN